ncbi:MAG: threonine/serine exporter, partial [Ruminiclostridium sp.]|nr:threonine/serine exporter [Ruminiclostridium sp.]
MMFMEFFQAFGGSFCAGLLFNIKGRKLLWAGLSGMAGWIVYE